MIMVTFVKGSNCIFFKTDYLENCMVSVHFQIYYYKHSFDKVNNKFGSCLSHKGTTLGI